MAEYPELRDLGDKVAIAVHELVHAVIAQREDLARRPVDPNAVVREFRPTEVAVVEKGNAFRNALIELIGTMIAGIKPSSPGTPPRAS